MTSLPKTLAKFGPAQNQADYISFEAIVESYPKNVVFIEFGPVCQTLWAFLSNFGSFMMPTHQIWSRHVTQDANFETF